MTETIAKPESTSGFQETHSRVFPPPNPAVGPTSCANRHSQSMSPNFSNALPSTYSKNSESNLNLPLPLSHLGGHSGPNVVQAGVTDHSENTSLLNDPQLVEKQATNPPPGSLSAGSINAFEVGESSRKNLVGMAWLVFGRTAGYTIFGIAVMILGIGIVEGAILPKIHTCPPSATCSAFWDPNSSNILNLLQILMNYWLKLGLVLASFGLLKLSAFQSWFILMKHGNTIDNLDLHLGAIKGSAFDAARLLLRKRNFILSLLVLALISIDSGINLFVGLSIIRTPGLRKTTFTYQGLSRLPNSKYTHLNTDGQVGAIAKVVSWALANDTSHHNAFRGSLVVPDSRTNFSVNARPSGPILDGILSCEPIPSTNITINTTAPVTYILDITVSGRVARFLAPSSTVLGVSEAGGIDTATGKYLWVSSAVDLLPNATIIDNGNFYATLCRHSLFMKNESVNDPNAQYVNPNAADVPGCDVTDTDACVADSVSNAILSWWGGLGQAIWDVNCRGGVLGPLDRGNISEPCPLTTAVWKETATSMLDGIMQTSPTDGPTTQQLIARVENINPGRWWLQGLIPAFSLLLYFVSLIYTCYLSQGNSTLKELNLAEIIGAAQTEHIRDLVQTGRLRKATVRYGNNQGFVNTESV
ncbi:hypothetical protein GALMADRAFT_1353280 [Galerina marginata CBS 339.88]|uniref:Uncharacterized protein n=1 Tax=Galerina marginata (strain CBS 339.88) TaxID=685588 RepID=A0A067SD93_GALM3|nr:hypothetical protein GALMADRAFT_1353280 [Galerina marginata CBS 339.88]